MKQRFLQTIAVVVIAMATGTNAHAEIASGISGTCSWVISDDSVLTISPTDGVSGVLESSESSSDAKWYSSRMSVKSVVVEKGVATNETPAYLFYELTNCTQMDLANLDVSKATTLDGMFEKCKSLTSLNINNWDVSNVTNLHYTFDRCQSLTSLDLNNWDVSNVTNLHYTFAACQSLTSLNVSNWDVSNVTTLTGTFGSCYSLVSLDVSNWNVSNLTEIRTTFQHCRSLVSLDVNKWNVSNVTTLIDVFYGCYSLVSLDLSNWNVSNVTYISGLFGACRSLKTLDLGGWNLSNVTSCSFLYSSGYGDGNLETLITPATASSEEVIGLPYTMYDWDNDNAEYTQLPGGSITLHKERNGGTIYYEDENGETTSVMYNFDVTTNDTEWNNAVYAVTSDTQISGRVTVTGTVDLILLDGVSLNISGDTLAGITVKRGAVLNIMVGNTNSSIKETGSLTVIGTTADSNNAGIGGVYDESLQSQYEAGTINIYGGKINVCATESGAGYGAGIGGCRGGDGGYVNIYGGTVVAKSSASGTSYGAGIGAGYEATGGTVYIQGTEAVVTMSGASAVVAESATATPNVSTAGAAPARRAPSASDYGVFVQYGNSETSTTDFTGEAGVTVNLSDFNGTSLANVPYAKVSFVDASGISEIKSEKTSDDATIYDLGGRRVKETAPGIYISNGRKFVVK